MKLSGSSPYPLPLVQRGFPRASDAAAAPAAFAICKFLSAHLCEKEGSVCSVRAGLAEGEAARRAETAVSTVSDTFLRLPRTLGPFARRAHEPGWCRPLKCHWDCGRTGWGESHSATGAQTVMGQCQPPGQEGAVSGVPAGLALALGVSRAGFSAGERSPGQRNPLGIRRPGHGQPLGKLPALWLSPEGDGMLPGQPSAQAPWVPPALGQAWGHPKWPFSGSRVSARAGPLCAGRCGGQRWVSGASQNPLRRCPKVCARRPWKAGAGGGTPLRGKKYTQGEGGLQDECSRG